MILVTENDSCRVVCYEREEMEALEMKELEVLGSLDNLIRVFFKEDQVVAVLIGDQLVIKFGDKEVAKEIIWFLIEEGKERLFFKNSIGLGSIPGFREVSDRIIQDEIFRFCSCIDCECKIMIREAV